MGGGKEGASGRLPSCTVHGSVGRLKGRRFANSEAVGQIFYTPPLFPPRLNEKSCWVEWERGQERSDSAGQAWMLAPRKGVRQMGSGPVGGG